MTQHPQLLRRNITLHTSPYVYGSSRSRAIARWFTILCTYPSSWIPESTNTNTTLTSNSKSECFRASFSRSTPRTSLSWLIPCIPLLSVQPVSFPKHTVTNYTLSPFGPTSLMCLAGTVTDHSGPMLWFHVFRAILIIQTLRFLMLLDLPYNSWSQSSRVWSTNSSHAWCPLTQAPQMLHTMDTNLQPTNMSDTVPKLQHNPSYKPSTSTVRDHSSMDTPNIFLFNKSFVRHSFFNQGLHSNSWIMSYIITWHAMMLDTFHFIDSAESALAPEVTHIHFCL